MCESRRDGTYGNHGLQSVGVAIGRAASIAADVAIDRATGRDKRLMQICVVSPQLHEVFYKIKRSYKSGLLCDVSRLRTH